LAKGDKMTKKGSAIATPAAESKDVFYAPGSRDRSPGRITAEVCLSPIVGNAVTARHFTKGSFGSSDLTDTGAVIAEFAAKAQKNDFSEVEATLIAQATTLNAIFAELARRAALNMGEYIQATETYLRLALKAQSQCRVTLQTLAEIKNPQPVAFVKQANIAHGHQQVNNGTQGDGGPSPRAGFSTKPSNELLEAGDEERLDAGATGTTGGASSHLETVGAIHRPPD
jgi:hypothetical protein